MTTDKTNYVCDRCGTDWEGAPGHPRDYCDSTILKRVAESGLAFLENKRSDTAVPYMRFKRDLELYFGRRIS